MKYKEFFGLNEGYHIDRFDDLPENEPYGFIVYPNGEFSVVKYFGGHEQAAAGFDPNENNSVDAVLRAGGLRIARYRHGDALYIAEFVRGRAKDVAKKTAKDLADYYLFRLEFDISPWVTVEGKLIEGNVHTFEDLPENPPYGFVVFKDGGFVTVKEVFGHDEVLNKFYVSIEGLLRNGGIRMVENNYGKEYQCEYDSNKVTSRAKKTAKDLCDFYNADMSYTQTNRDFYEDPADEEIVLKEDYPANFKMQEFQAVRSFAAKYRYAEAHLQKIASGTGRAVFNIDGRKVIKIAKNRKGLAQNSVEAERFLQNYDIVARVFDTDEFNFWVEMEFAKATSRKRFFELTGVTLEDLDEYLKYQERYRKFSNLPNRIPADLAKQMEESEFVTNLISLNADYDMATGDMGRLSTWGEVIRDGKPQIVLVDFGLTRSVWNDYYRVKG